MDFAKINLPMRDGKNRQVGNGIGYKALIFKPLKTGCDVSSPAFPPKARLRNTQRQVFWLASFLAPSQGH
jgi:hypothetical protein